MLKNARSENPLLAAVSSYHCRSRKEIYFKELMLAKMRTTASGRANRPNQACRVNGNSVDSKDIMATASERPNRLKKIDRSQWTLCFAPTCILPSLAMRGVDNCHPRNHAYIACHGLMPLKREANERAKAYWSYPPLQWISLWINARSPQPICSFVERQKFVQ